MDAELSVAVLSAGFPAGDAGSLSDFLSATGGVLSPAGVVAFCPAGGADTWLESCPSLVAAGSAAVGAVGFAGASGFDALPSGGCPLVPSAESPGPGAVVFAPAPVPGSGFKIGPGGLGEPASAFGVSSFPSLEPFSEVPESVGVEACPSGRAVEFPPFAGWELASTAAGAAGAESAAGTDGRT